MNTENKPNQLLDLDELTKDFTFEMDLCDQQRCLGHCELKRQWFRRTVMFVLKASNPEIFRTQNAMQRQIFNELLQGAHNATTVIIKDGGIVDTKTSPVVDVNTIKDCARRHGVII